MADETRYEFSVYLRDREAPLVFEAGDLEVHTIGDMLMRWESTDLSLDHTSPVYIKTGEIVAIMRKKQNG
jgi:ketosteroid isomerase-like protein